MSCETARYSVFVGPVADSAQRGLVAGLTALAFFAALLSLGLEHPSDAASAPASAGISAGSGDPSDRLTDHVPSAAALEELGAAESTEETDPEGRDRTFLGAWDAAASSSGLLHGSEAFTRVARSRAVLGAHRPRGPPSV